MQLVIEDLSKTYPNDVVALRHVNLTISTGMFGLLGPNGAGKSTLMRTIATLQEPDSGSIRLDDIDVIAQKHEVRKLLGYLPQEFGVYPRISAFDMLEHIAVLKGLPGKKNRREQVDALLHKTNLWDHRHKPLGSFSGGMKQRFGIAQALVGSPTLIIVDEPTAGLDPAERSRFLNLLSEMGENTIVILSTHIVEDVNQLCSQMAIISKGELLYTGSPGQARQELDGKVWRKVIRKSDIGTYRDQFKVLSEKLTGGNLEIHVLGDTQPDSTFTPVPVDLEDVYFANLTAAYDHINVQADV